MIPIAINISDSPLALEPLNAAIQSAKGRDGAAVIFTGSVRSEGAEQGLIGMYLEHYPGMTEKQLQSICLQAAKQWSVNQIQIAHRVGTLQPGEPIVFVGVSALHRAEAFNAAAFIMDYLKRDATFWKKEIFSDRSHWVEAKQSDLQATERWQNHVDHQTANET